MSHGSPGTDAIYGLMAEFDNPTDLVVAANRARLEGYREMDAYSPMPIEELNEALGIRKTKLPLIVLIGGIFVIETLSVIAQVFHFKRTREKLLLCSPLHNHYLFAGHHEMKIVVRFWIISALLALFAVASLKIR